MVEPGFERPFNNGITFEAEVRSRNSGVMAIHKMSMLGKLSLLFIDIFKKFAQSVSNR